MTGLVRKATLFGVCGLFVAGAALANVPSPGNSDVPAVIHAMGTDGANLPHSLASPVSGTPRSFTITVRDFTNNPIAGSVVTLDFTLCTDFHVCDVEPAGEPQQTTNCGPPHSLTGTTNAAGVFSATLIGGGDLAAAPTPAPGVANYCVEVIADGVSLGFASLYMANPNGWALDLVDGVDNVIHFIDFLTVNTQRSDFDGDGDNDGVDNAETFVIFVQGQSSQGCDGPNNVGGVAGGYCP